MDKLRVFEAFSGYGSQSLALERLGIEHEVVAISEIDKYALQAYYALHNKDIPNLGDISKLDVNDIPKHDLFTYSFPCQDISVAGKTKGIVKGETRSGLLYECERIIEAKRPKYLLLENVKNLVGKKFKSQFEEWLAYLENLGYTNYWKVLNAKDYGVPQNRERVFVVSILGQHKAYEFPKKLELTKKLKDILEEETDNKHHLSDNTIKKIIVVDKNIKPSVKLNFEREKNEISKSNKEIYQCKCNSGWQDNKVGIKVAPTLRANNSHTCIYSDFRIRKLTPKECFRLMGLKDDDIDKIQATGVSNTQQYKMAGNSIVVDVLEAIFKNLFL